MPRFLLLLVLAAAAVPASAAAATPRIVGGTAAGDTDYPAQAELSFTVGRDSYLCGGTLVAPQWVLTAGHCVSDENTGALVSADAYTVRLGSTALDQGTPYAVDSISRAPSFSLQTLAYDAALLHLTTPATETPLALASAAPATGTVARVIGWGTTSENGEVSTTLQQVDVPIVSDSTCQRAYGTSLIAATMECAGYAAGGMDACQGDSGGPLLVSENGAWVLAGIVSTGDGCAEAGRYGIYTDMTNTALRTWFASTTGIAAPVATPTPTATPAVTAVATAAPLVPRATLHLARRCTATSCAFAVNFTTTGTVSARVTVHGRRIASGSVAIATAGTHVLHLRFAYRVTRSQTARLRVVATPTGGTSTTARRSVRIHV